MFKWAVLVTAVLGSGPCYCYDDECKSVGQMRCQDGVLVGCRQGYDEYGPTGKYIDRVDCAEAGQICVDFEAEGLSACAPAEEVCPVDALGSGRCVTLEGEEVAEICTLRESCTDPCDGREPCEEAPRCAERATWQRAGPCERCDTHCDCEVGSACQEGLCQVGEAPEDLRCCDRARGADCPEGETCVGADGVESVCAGGERCAPCDTLGDCADLPCLELPDGARACVDPQSQSATTRRCRTMEGEPLTVWSQTACGGWHTLVEVCLEKSRCEDGTCIPIWPDIEVNPTLLELPEATVGQAVSGRVAIGNLGEARLDVTGVRIESQIPDLFSVSPDTAAVEVDEIIELEVRFTPNLPGDFSARLIISSDDPDEPEVQVLLNATAQP